MNEPVNKVNEIKKYEFKLLREEAVENDVFEDRTHEKIADSLAQLIKKEDKGITIGLEGAWGSGKSTVISILRKRLKGIGLSIPLVQFDAWAHEGDPLRRIFLESLIDGLSNEYGKTNDKLEMKKAQISKHTVVKNISTKQSATLLGKLITISLITVPLGTSLIGKVDFTALTISGKPYWLFIVSIIFALAPLGVIIIHLLYLIFKEKFEWGSIFSFDNWAFLEKNAQDTIKQESSEEDERTSIEFEKDFNIIIKESMDSYKVDKLVIVIDNLDRIDPKDSLKIWSTLQTFLQQRNQPDQSYKWFEKVWVIVPYDSDGLASLWDNKKEGNNTCKPSKSFFDKSFQLRLEVPKPVFTGWELFLKKQMDDCLISWDKDDKEVLVQILRMTRRNLNDIPTPREIKNYVNQVGFLASSCGEIISISSIAYYVIWRELYFVSVDEIRQNLISNVLMNDNLVHLSALSPSVKKELAGLIFGVSPEKGEQLLLLPEISKSLLDGNGELLNELSINHGDGFWMILNYHIVNTHIDLGIALRAGKAIFEGLWSNNKNNFNEFIIKIKSLDLEENNSSDLSIIFANRSNITDFTNLIKICASHKNFALNLYYYLIDDLKKYIGKNDVNTPFSIVENLIEVINFLNSIDCIPHRIVIGALSINKLIPFSSLANEFKFTLFNYIVPHESIVQEIPQMIQPSLTIHPGLYDAIIYSINSGYNENWDVVAIQCKAYIDWNNGQFSNQSEDVFKIINEIAFRFPNTLEIIKNMLREQFYYNLLWSIKDSNLIYASLICAGLLKNELFTMTIPNFLNSITCLEEIKKFWRTAESINAKQMIEQIKKYNLWSLIWELAADNNNKLAGEIITNCIDDSESVGLFNGENGLEKLKYYTQVTGKDRKIKEIANELLKHSKIEDEIINTTEHVVELYYYELFYLIRL